MTEEEPYVSVRMKSAFAGILTCLTVVFAFFVFSGAYDYKYPFVMIWFLGGYLVVSVSLWLDVAEKKEKICNRRVRYSQAILHIAHIIFGFLVLLNILLP